MLWTSLPARVLAARLWPEPDTRPDPKAEPSFTQTPQEVVAGESTSLSALIAALPSDLLERLRPSNVAEWLLCPLRAKFKRAWEPRFGEWDPAQAMGTAVHRGVYTALSFPDRSRVALDDAREAASQALQQAFQPQSRWELGKLEKLAHKGVQAALDELQNLLPLLYLEEKMYLGTPDIVSGAMYSRELVVTDIKCHMESRSERYIDEWSVSPQLWAYSDEAQRFHGLPVSWYRVLEVYFTPKVKAQMVPFPVTPEKLAFARVMLRDAAERIIEEYRGDRPEVPNLHGCYRYGRCPAYEACWNFSWNPGRMTTLYRVKGGSP